MLRSAPDELENNFTRWMMHSVFTGSVKTGRWVSDKMACCYHRKEHKLARMTSNWAGGLYAKKIDRVEFTVAPVAGIPCRIYRPKMFDQSADEKSSPKLPVVVYIHGGGWTICSARAYHEFTAKLARDTGTIVVSVEYSLGPEKPYPHGYEDCLAVVRALLNADSMPLTPFISGRVDASRVIVGGDSAGGNLSAAVALDLIRFGEKRLSGLILICPALQACYFDFQSYQDYAPKFGLDWFVAHYAGIKPSTNVLQAMKRSEHLTNECRQLVVKYFPKHAANAMATDSKGPSNSVPVRLVELCSNVAAWPLLADDDHLQQVCPYY